MGNHLGDDSLQCKEEKDNEYNKHAVEIVYDSFHSNKVAGHVLLYWSELANKFLKFSNHHIPVVTTSKRVNKGIGLGLDIPFNYFFHGDNWVSEWFKKSIEGLDKCIDVKVEKWNNLWNLFIYKNVLKPCTCFVIVSWLIVSAIMSVLYKSVCYIEGLLCDFEQDSAVT